MAKIINSLGIIGCGNMGTAILKSIKSKKKLKVNDIHVFDKDTAKAESASGQYGAHNVSSCRDVIQKSGIIILAVKPQDSKALLDEIAAYLDSSKLVISIMAGVKTETITQAVKKDIPVARVMPNMAAYVGKAVSGISYNRFVKPEHKEKVKAIFSSIGKAVKVNEDMQDAITALTGSGPAYFFYFVESLIEAAVKELGFSDKQAIKLVKLTMEGSIALLKKHKLSPEELRSRVTSKGGTTEAAVKVFEDNKMKEIINKALLAAKNRSKELSL